jgi:two-component system, OmpR family, KDP operon response regulator KdpE
MTEAMHLILIFEDDQAMQNILRMFFERPMASESCSPTPLFAASWTRDCTGPDLVLVDLGLPDRDGIHVISAIRAWSPVPIVVLTAQTAWHNGSQRLSSARTTT